MNGFLLSTPGFSGTPELLLHLVKEAELKIEDLSISKLIGQFLGYIRYLEKISLDEAGEFIVIASLLMRLKVSQLIPSLSEEEGLEAGPDELMRNLQEYRKFKEVAAALKTKEEERRLLFDRGYIPEEGENGDEELIEASLFDLLEALRAILPGLSTPEPMEVRAEEITIEEKMELILRRLREEGRIGFASLLDVDLGKRHVVVTFVALLELIRLGVVRAKQRKAFSEITIVLGMGQAAAADVSRGIVDD
ncbi:MAG: segregation/condensation protein A [Candidatus Eisenbacteria bacterium]|nr:segregation/condensation protein A [Candidatus Eisenbacteria bacterium]